MNVDSYLEYVIFLVFCGKHLKIEVSPQIKIAYSGNEVMIYGNKSILTTTR